MKDHEKHAFEVIFNHKPKFLFDKVLGLSTDAKLRLGVMTDDGSANVNYIHRTSAGFFDARFIFVCLEDYNGIN